MLLSCYIFALIVLAQTVHLNFSQSCSQSNHSVVDRTPTLEGAGRLLSQSEVLLGQMVDRLVLVDLHTGAHVALAVQEEGEGAG